MNKTTWLMLAALTLPWAGAAEAGLIYQATLSGANEAPPNLSTGTGDVTVVYDAAAQTLAVDVTFSGLTGTSTNAHIHCCAPPGVNAGVATPLPTFPGFPAGVFAGVYSQVFDLTLAASFNPAFVTANGGSPAGAEAALAAGLAAGTAYFNLHTSAFPPGEIRGNLALVPEPTPLLLLGIGAAGAGALRVRRRRRPTREVGA